ncbi:hypothetical protein A7981_06260 [Methylovorus sp. MM2]|nr:hypothetical protein A7981_06260 [Methylovorus sp. MM2]
MKVDIYKSASSNHKFISVVAGSDISHVEVQDPDFAKLIRKSSGVELDESPASLITSDIKKQGYHLHLARYPIC